MSAIALTARQLHTANEVARAAAIRVYGNRSGANRRIVAQVASDAIREMATFDVSGERVDLWEQLRAEDVRGSAAWKTNRRTTCDKKPALGLPSSTLNASTSLAQSSA